MRRTCEGVPQRPVSCRCGGASAQMRSAEKPVAPQICAFVGCERLVLGELALPERCIEREVQLSRWQHVVATPAANRHSEPLLAAREHFLRQQRMGTLPQDPLAR